MSTHHSAWSAPVEARRASEESQDRPQPHSKLSSMRSAPLAKLVPQRAERCGGSRRADLLCNGRDKETRPTGVWWDDLHVRPVLGHQMKHPRRGDAALLDAGCVNPFVRPSSERMLEGYVRIGVAS